MVVEVDDAATSRFDLAGQTPIHRYDSRSLAYRYQPGIGEPKRREFAARRERPCLFVPFFIPNDKFPQRFDQGFPHIRWRLIDEIARLCQNVWRCY